MRAILQAIWNRITSAWSRSADHLDEPVNSTEDCAPVFYRKLFSDSHVTRWTDKQFTSFHRHGPPPAWVFAAQEGKTGSESFQVETTNGMSLASARDEFMKHCLADPGAFENLPPNVKKTITELDGVCAFDNSAGAYWYGVESKDSDRFVAFHGVEVFRLKSESNGGVQARVVEPVGGIMIRDEFIEQHCDGETPPYPEGIPTDGEGPGLTHETPEDDDEYGEMPDVRPRKGETKE